MNQFVVVFIDRQTEKRYKTAYMAQSTQRALNAFRRDFSKDRYAVKKVSLNIWKKMGGQCYEMSV